MPSQAMNQRKKAAVSYPKSKYEDYENGKIRDKKQKKLSEFTEDENWRTRKSNNVLLEDKRMFLF